LNNKTLQFVTMSIDGSDSDAHCGTVRSAGVRSTDALQSSRSHHHWTASYR